MYFDDITQYLYLINIEEWFVVLIQYNDKVFVVFWFIHIYIFCCKMIITVQVKIMKEKGVIKKGLIGLDRKALRL